VIYSSECLAATTGRPDLADALEAVARRTAAFLAVSNGPDDILFIDAGAVRRMPVFKICAVDTLGAGDARTALLRLRSPRVLPKPKRCVSARRWPASNAPALATLAGCRSAPTWRPCWPQASRDAFVGASNGAMGPGP
jgi:pfkB family carbohydrate kinase